MNTQAVLRRKYILSDVIACSIAYLLYDGLRNAIEYDVPFTLFRSYLFTPKALAVYFVFIVYWLAFFFLSGYYNKPVGRSRLVELSTSVLSIVFGSVPVFFVWVVDDILHNTDLYLPLYLYLVVIMLGVVYPLRIALTTWFIDRARRQGIREKVLLITDHKALDKARNALANKRQEIVDIIEISFEKTTEGREDILKEQLDRIGFAISLYNPDALVVSIEAARAELVSLLLYKLYPFKLPVKVPIESLFFAGAKIKVASMVGEPMVDMTATNMAEWEKNIKWLFDKLLSILLLVLSSPLLLYLAIRVKLSSDGPVFFSQERIGLHGQPFMIYKFRTMFLGAEANGPQLSSDDDSRITKVGRTLRKYRLDELPQFWNVLKGDMSFVGPRPERAYYIRQLIHHAPYYYLLHNVRPGITSWGMVRYGYASNLEEMKERLKYDWLYYENMSLQLDLAVLVYTVRTLIKGSGK